MLGISGQKHAFLCSRKSTAYDEDLFFVDYQTVGANIYPDVTIIEKGAGK